jgi:para-aminobenzoate synthetase component I
VNKTPAIFPINNFTEFRIQLLNWANQFNIFCLLDNQHYNFTAPAFECLLATGSKRTITAKAGTAFAALRTFSKENNGWLFGHLGYDLKNETEKLQSQNFDGIGFDDLFFFEPELVIKLTEKQVVFFNAADDARRIFNDIQQCHSYFKQDKGSANTINNRISKEAYIDSVQKLRQHILKGDCYEINFCQEFFSENADIDPLETYHKLVNLSPNPFAALYKLNNRFCICASPERYLKKEGKKIFSQPIKGTSKRDLLNKQNDLKNKNYLSENEKEKSENVMVVDLVRNDLSKVCKEGSVKVDELFGVYSFPQVHQMMSTISGTIEDGIDWTDIVKATFPMGSMTGAPKKRVMQLIEQYEQTRRGLFSGAIGYINPDGDFDFNVVIRSIFYNASTGYLSFQAGSAITFYSDAEKEYEECLLKAAVIKKILE